MAVEYRPPMPSSGESAIVYALPYDESAIAGDTPSDHTGLKVTTDARWRPFPFLAPLRTPRSHFDRYAARLTDKPLGCLILGGIGG